MAIVVGFLLGKRCACDHRRLQRSERPRDLANEARALSYLKFQDDAEAEIAELQGRPFLTGRKCSERRTSRAEYHGCLSAGAATVHAGRATMRATKCVDHGCEELLDPWQ